MSSPAKDKNIHAKKKKKTIIIIMLMMAGLLQ